jgi:hypothetical protein
MRDRQDGEWRQEKTDQASGFHSTSTFDTRPLMKGGPSTRPGKGKLKAKSRKRRSPPIWPFFLVAAILAGVALALSVAPGVH